MKKALSFVICFLFFVSVALATPPHPKSKNQNKMRLPSGKTLPPKPSKIKK